MECSEIMEIYQKSLRSELLPGEKIILEKHLAACEDCNNAFNWDSVIVPALKNAEQVTAQKDFIARVYKKLLLPKLPNENYFLQDMILYAAAAFTAVAISILWFGFFKNIQSGILGITTDFSGIALENLPGFFTSITKMLLPQEIYTLIPPDFTWLIWIVLVGCAYFVVSAFFQISPYSLKR